MRCDDSTQEVEDHPSCGPWWDKDTLTTLFLLSSSNHGSHRVRQSQHVRCNTSYTNGMFQILPFVYPASTFTFLTSPSNKLHYINSYITSITYIILITIHSDNSLHYIRQTPFINLIYSTTLKLLYQHKLHYSYPVTITTSNTSTHLLALLTPYQ